MSNRCMICGKSVSTGEQYHSTCCKSFFGTALPPVLPYGKNDLNTLASELINNNMTVTGVQKKLSLHLSAEAKQQRLTFVNLWGEFILKPQVESYSELPENEFLTMCLADMLKIKTVPHALIRMKSGDSAYITKRIDRSGDRKIHMEDMCQLSEKATEDKYRGSLEQVGKIVNKYCSNRLLDALRFFELVLFAYITGNSDMHLKNFSLIEYSDGIALVPAYDLLNTRLVISEKDDPDESALSINGKRRKIGFSDFFEFGLNLSLSEKQIENVFKRFFSTEAQLILGIENSFLCDEGKQRYKKIFLDRLEKLRAATK